MNPVLVSSSLLFLVPLFVSLALGQHLVSIGTAICLATSLANHYYETKPLQYLDIVVVNTIAAYFTLHSVKCSRNAGHFMVVAIALTTMGYYLYTKRSKKPPHWHAVVHLLASVGIVVYTIACSSN